jgi:glycosyltransferase involved in cell wall biosynthesis
MQNYYNYMRMITKNSTSSLALISSEYWPEIGGIGRYSKIIIDESSAVFNTCVVITRQNNKASENGKTKFIKSIPTSWFSVFSLVKLLLSLPKIRSELKKSSDILICDIGGMYLYVISTLFSFKRRSGRVQFVLHGTEIIRNKKYLKNRVILKIFKKFVKRQNLEFIAISYTVKNLLDSLNVGISSRVVYNAVSGKIIVNSKNQAKEQAGDWLEILIVGRLDYRKRIDLILKAAHLYERKIFLNVVGVGPTDKILKNLAQQYKNDKFKVKFYGRLSDESLNKLYKRMDLVFIPAGRANRSIEGFGLTIIEALKHGVMPICINLDGPGEVAQLLGTPVVEMDVVSIANYLNRYEISSIDTDIYDRLGNLFTPTKQFTGIFSK